MENNSNTPVTNTEDKLQKDNPLLNAEQIKSGAETAPNAAPDSAPGEVSEAGSADENDKVKETPPEKPDFNEHNTTTNTPAPGAEPIPHKDDSHNDDNTRVKQVPPAKPDFAAGAGATTGAQEAGENAKHQPDQQQQAPEPKAAGEGDAAIDKNLSQARKDAGVTE